VRARVVQCPRLSLEKLLRGKSPAQRLCCIVDGSGGYRFSGVDHHRSARRIGGSIFRAVGSSATVFVPATIVGEPAFCSSPREWRPPGICRLVPLAECASLSVQWAPAGKYLGVATLEETLQNAGSPTMVAARRPSRCSPTARKIEPPMRRQIGGDLRRKIDTLHCRRRCSTGAGGAFPREVTFPNSDETPDNPRPHGIPVEGRSAEILAPLDERSRFFTAQHRARAPIALAAIKSDDDNLAKVLAGSIQGLRTEPTSSSFPTTVFDYRKERRYCRCADEGRFFATAKFKETPKPGDILVVVSGGRAVLRNGTMQRSPKSWSISCRTRTLRSVILTREKNQRHIHLEQVHLNTRRLLTCCFRCDERSHEQIRDRGSMTGDNSRKRTRHARDVEPVRRPQHAGGFGTRFQTRDD